MVHLSEISLVLVENTTSFFSTYLLAELAKAKIPLVVCDEKHNPIGEYLPLYGSHNSSKKIKEQIEWSDSLCASLWRRIVRSKIRNQAHLLQDNGLASAIMLYDYADCVEDADRTNREGHAAKVYFNSMFGKGFSRDQDNSVNAILDYGYSILLSYTSREVVSRGYLTQWGIFHRNEYNHYNLACDFMEPYRPVVDRYALNNSDRQLDKDTKIEIIELFDNYHTFNEGKYRLQSIISLGVKNNLAILSCRRSVDEYLEFEVNEG